jgi:hypothetical protein
MRTSTPTCVFGAQEVLCQISSSALCAHPPVKAPRRKQLCYTTHAQLESTRCADKVTSMACTDVTSADEADFRFRPFSGRNNKEFAFDGGLLARHLVYFGQRRVSSGCNHRLLVVIYAWSNHVVTHLHSGRLPWPARVIVGVLTTVRPACPKRLR